MGLFSKRVPERKWIDVAPSLGQALKNSGDEFYPMFLSHAATQGLPSSLSETGRHYVAMLQLSATASTIVENGYVSDPTFFLELVYIATTGQRPEQMHADIEHYNRTQTPDDPRASLATWASTMAKELSAGTNNTALAAELVSYGALLVVQAKILTCDACGDRKGAKKVQQAAR